MGLLARGGGSGRATLFGMSDDAAQRRSENQGDKRRQYGQSSSAREQASAREPLLDCRGPTFARRETGIQSIHVRGPSF